MSTRDEPLVDQNHKVAWSRFRRQRILVTVLFVSVPAVVFAFWEKSVIIACFIIGFNVLWWRVFRLHAPVVVPIFSVRQTWSRQAFLSDVGVLDAEHGVFNMAQHERAHET